MLEALVVLAFDKSFTQMQTQSNRQEPLSYNGAFPRTVYPLGVVSTYSSLSTPDIHCSWTSPQQLADSVTPGLNQSTPYYNAQPSTVCQQFKNLSMTSISDGLKCSSGSSTAQLLYLLDLGSDIAMMCMVGTRSQSTVSTTSWLDLGKPQRLNPIIMEHT
jgi:hypothetical protein